MEKRHHALIGWGVVLGTVVAYDVWAVLTRHETLSAAFWRGKHTTVGKIVLGGAWLGLTWHLLIGDKSVLSQDLHTLYTRIHPFHRGWRWLQDR